MATLRHIPNTEIDDAMWLRLIEAVAFEDDRLDVVPNQAEQRSQR